MFGPINCVTENRGLRDGKKGLVGHVGPAGPAHSPVTLYVTRLHQRVAQWSAIESVNSTRTEK